MRFEPISADNQHVVDTVFAGEQAQYWVHYNAYWRENAEKKSDIFARLIYVDDFPDPVGFIAYGQHYQDEDLTQPVPGWYEVIHLVIDVNHQRRGYGRAATLMTIELLKANPDCQCIVIAYNPDNLPARSLYESMGFVEFGRNYDDDPLLKLQL
jgi:diamine N-acetyltransferase